ncbi:hypothetical protein HK101_002010, partial [Irineochytrium annulatum]
MEVPTLEEAMKDAASEFPEEIEQGRHCAEDEIARVIIDLFVFKKEWCKSEGRPVDIDENIGPCVPHKRAHWETSHTKADIISADPLFDEKAPANSRDATDDVVVVTNDDIIITSSQHRPVALENDDEVDEDEEVDEGDDKGGAGGGKTTTSIASVKIESLNEVFRLRAAFDDRGVRTIENRTCEDDFESIALFLWRDLKMGDEKKLRTLADHL